MRSKSDIDGVDVISSCCAIRHQKRERDDLMLADFQKRRKKTLMPARPLCDKSCQEKMRLFKKKSNFDYRKVNPMLKIVYIRGFEKELRSIILKLLISVFWFRCGSSTSAGTFALGSILMNFFRVE